MNKIKFNFKTILIIEIMCVIFVCAFVIIFNYDKIFTPQIKEPEILNLINVRGYEFDKEFNKNLYDYNITVNENVIEISCDTTKEIKGCNVRLDLSEKENYIHKIKVFNGKKNVVYSINIKKEINSKDKEFYIQKINGNTFEWTNKDITLEVIVSPEGTYKYSFDGGNTWQDSNTHNVKENGKFEVIIKNDKGELSNKKIVEVDKIDKKSPIVTINKKKIESSKMVLEVSAYDELSGTESISFNGSEFSTNTKYVITKPGKYYAIVKDKAGNISEKKYIEVNSSELMEETTEVKPEEKIYTVTLKENGANIEKK